MTHLSPAPGSLEHPLEKSSTVYAWAYQRVLFPAWQSVVRRRPIREHLAGLEESQWLPRAELERAQVASLRAVLEHAGRNVPYWRTLFRKLGFDARDVRQRGRSRRVARADARDDPRALRRVRRPGAPPDEHLQGNERHVGRPAQVRVLQPERGAGARRRACVATAGRGYAWGCRRCTTGARAPGCPRGSPGRKMRLDRALKREVYVDAARQDEASMRSFAELLARHAPARRRGLHAGPRHLRAMGGRSQATRNWPDTACRVRGRGGPAARSRGAGSSVRPRRVRDLRLARDDARRRRVRSPRRDAHRPRRTSSSSCCATASRRDRARKATWS